MADSPLGSVKDAVAGIGLGKIVFLLLVIALVVGYVFFFPKNGSVTITVKALDGDALPGAEVTLVDSNGNSLEPAYSDDAGRAEFKNVAPGDYSASIDAGAGFKSASKSISLTSGGETSETAEVERASSVSVTPQENPSFLALSCEKKILFELKNSGASEEQASLVADGALKDVFIAPTVASVVPAGGSNFVEASFLAGKGKPGDSVKGRIRVRGSRSGADFAFTLGNAPAVAVSPQTISGSAPAGGMIQQKLVVSNDGDSPLEISQDSITVEGHYAGSYAWTYFQPRIEPKSKASWWIALRVPENAVGKLVGVMKIPLPCRTVSIDIDTDAKD